MTFDTTFVGTDDSIVASTGLRTPSKGEIFLLERDDNNFVANASVISDNALTDIEGTVVSNKYGVDLSISGLETIITLTSVATGAAIDETIALSTGDAVIITTGATVGGAVISTTTVPETLYSVTGTADAEGTYSDTITVQDVSGNTGTITINLVVTAI